MYLDSLKRLWQNQFSIKNSEDCKYLQISFESTKDRPCTIIIRDNRGKALLSIEYNARKGINNLTMDKLNIIYDSIDVEIKYSDYSRRQSNFFSCRGQLTEFNQAKINPNPTTGTIVLSFDHKLEDNLTLIIYNSTGQTVSSREINLLDHQVEINIADFVSGIYYFYLYSPRGRIEIENNKIIKL